ISPGSEWVEIGSSRKHIMSYLADFLFAPERARSPVRSLSGGERNRLLLARLFARPANVLVLDEPTNDLDIETLEMLEALLQEYTGTVFLVSHDRAFLDNVVTEVIAFEGAGVLREHVGGYSDWAEYQRTRADDAGHGTVASPSPSRAQARDRQSADSLSSTAPIAAKASAKAQARRELSFSERHELTALPGRIEALERRLAQMQQRFADPALYRDAAQDAKRLQQELADAERELAGAYARWEALEAIRA
ncbi:MAG: ATP-binding cassette domain-containing protein, partial [Casimicrobiaceae bacterium]